MKSNQTGLFSTQEQEQELQPSQDRNLESNNRLINQQDKSKNTRNNKRTSKRELTAIYTTLPQSRKKSPLSLSTSSTSLPISVPGLVGTKFCTPASHRNNNNKISNRTSARLHPIIRSSRNRISLATSNNSSSIRPKGNNSHSPTHNSSSLAGIHHHHHQAQGLSPSENPTTSSDSPDGEKIASKNPSSRRIFTPEFKRTVVNAFAHDPECFGNQRATARKFRIHRRQVQKWIQQTTKTSTSSSTSSATTAKVSNTDAACESLVEPSITTATTTTTTIPPLKSSSPRSSSSVMANAINTLLSLRDAVRIKAPWSPQSGSSATNISAAALNLGLLSNSAAMLHDLDPSPPQSSTPTGNKSSNSSGTPGRQDSNRSPRISPQSSTSMSPSTRSNNHGGNQYCTGNSNGINNSNSTGDNDLLLSPAEIIDELSYLYPQEDFTLLRKACMKNEITLTKLTSRLSSYNYSSTLTPSPSNGSNGTGSGSLKDDFVTQQTLQLLKQQNEYVQMLQQSGVSLPVFPGDMASLAAGLTDSHSNSKYSTWFHPLAQAAAAAAAAGMSLPSSSGSGTSNGGSGATNGGNGKKSKSNSDHMFLSPKTPALSSAKPKTVAAALAATRHSPNIIGNLSGLGNGKVKKPVLPRKRQSRPKSSTITRPSLVMQDDDIDPSSMVETTTTIPPEYGGMDLSASSSSKGFDGDSIGRRIKQEQFLYSENSGGADEAASELKSNGHNLLNAASLTLENYLRNVMPTKKSPSTTTNGGSLENARASPATLPLSEQASTMSESDKKKQQVLEAFNDDEEVAGDARGVARKFGLNIRVVLKWLREGPSKSLPALPTTMSLQNSNGRIQSIITSFSEFPTLDQLTNGDHSTSAIVNNNNENNNNNIQQKKNLPNKRKTAKPNQICDFQDDDLPDDSDTIPLDMVVPIKKRRVSNSNASS